MGSDFDFGAYHRDIVTSDEHAARWFDRGMVWAQGFHHEEAIRCFERGSAADPTATMLHLGVALSHAPNYNFHAGNGFYGATATAPTGNFPSWASHSAAVDRAALTGGASQGTAAGAGAAHLMELESSLVALFVAVVNIVALCSKLRT